MADFLLELRSEEIPARMQDKARDDLARLFTAELAKSGLTAAAITTYATPRRLTLIARDLPLETAAIVEETKGPKTSAPPQALEGFLRKTGLTREQLIERDGILFAVVNKPGRATADVLAQAIPAIVRGFPWPKSMRWGHASTTTESLKWVRPLQGIVALLGEEIVGVEIAGIASGASAGKVGTGFPSADATIKSSAATVGHRFHHPGPITIGSASNYVEKLRACHVIVDQDERRAAIRTQATALAAQAGLELIEDEGLVAENAGLTEWPVPLLGRFDAAFLGVPPEVIQLTARVNQKYFVCRDADGKLANAFICTANIDAADGGAKIVEGNRKVLAARLSDAKFFYDTDLKVPLDVQREKLGSIVFHEKLGTVADKVDRVAKLARWLVEDGIVLPAPLPGREGSGVGSESQDRAGKNQPTPDPSLPGRGEAVATLATQAERAALLCKADLVTGMVGEFPELQGLMGGYYALAQGEDPAVAEAIRDHYKPVGQGDAVPTTPVTVAVSLADKLDTIYNFFQQGDAPTGSKDPFALRRQALAVIALITTCNMQLNLRSALHQAGQCRFNQIMDRAVMGRPSLESFIVRGLQGETRDDDWMMRLKEAMSMDLGPIELTFADNGMSEVVAAFKMQEQWPKLSRRLLNFFADRLKVQQREAGVRHDLIDAVFALGGEDDLVRLLARVHALQAFVGTPDGANLLAGYKRAANILKKEGVAPTAGTSAQPTAVIPAKAGISGEGAGQEPQETPAFAGVTDGAGDSGGANAEKPLSYTPEKDETALIAALDAAAPRAADAVAREDFEGAMAALATLRAPIDAFFETVTVNDPAPAKRDARLHLLARVRAAVHTVADFSKIEG